MQTPWCVKVYDTWLEIQTRHSHFNPEDFNIKTENIPFGSWNNNNKMVSQNIVYIITKQYIFYCARSGMQPNIPGLQLQFRKKIEEQQLLAKINGRGETFDKQWGPIILYLL